MRMRKDALLSAANFISIFDKKAREIHSDLRATVGNIIALPGSRNTVSGYSYFTIDIRHPDSKILDLIEKEIYNIGSDLELIHKTKIRINKIYDLPTVNFNSKIINLVQKASEELKYSSLRMISGAGHDAVFLSNKCPTGMIFIPCYNGISHSENEFASENDLVNGCNVLLQTILKLDNAEISNY